MPPPLRYPSYRPRISGSPSPPWLRFFAMPLLVAFLFTLTACPEPPPSEKTDEPVIEAAIEKTDPTPEESTTNEEIVTVEEPTNPEDGGTEREPEKSPDDPNAVVITSINGNGSELPIAYGGTIPPQNPREASHRFTDSWSVIGQNLDKVTEWRLQHSLTSQSFTLTSDNKDSVMKLTLPKELIAGLFFLIGFIGSQEVVRAQTFVLQGENGKDGDSRFSEADANLLRALLTKLKSDGNNLEITASQIILKENQNTTSATIGLGAQTTTLTTENFNLVSKEASLLAETKTDITTPAFSVKSSNNNVSLELDAASREIRIQAANGADIASFTLKHQFIPEVAVPATPATHPSATFRNLNLHVQSGAGSTNATINGRGNLIVGYNGRVERPTALRQGSHNLIVGDDHDYRSFAGLVSGKRNTLIGGYATVAGGSGNSAGGTHATVAGGRDNVAGKEDSSICSSVGVEILINSSTPLRYCCGQTF